MRILVIGGAGFQGSHLCQALIARGDQVTILNTFSKRAAVHSAITPMAETVWGSITDKQIVKKTVREHDLVFDLASNIHVDESRVDPESYYKTNVLGTLNVVNECIAQDIPLIYVSSCEVYGYSHQPCMEHTALRPRSPYAASKAGADCLVYSHAITYDHPMMVLRPTNVFGTRQRYGGIGAVIPIFASQASAGKPLTIYGDGSQRRDFIYIKDLVQSYLFLIDLLFMQLSTSYPPVVNIGTSSSISILELAELVNAYFNNPKPIEHLAARPGEVKSFIVRSTILKELGFTPQYTFEDALLEYLRNWRVCS